MNADRPDHNEADFDDDEATLAASSDALNEIRAEAARVRDKQAANFDPSEDPTTVMIDFADDTELGGTDLGDAALGDGDLGEEPTIVGFDPAEDPTVITFDTAQDRTTKFVEQPAKKSAEPRKTPTKVPAKVVAEGSLIEGKAPPAADANYWDRNELAAESLPEVAPGKGPVPFWFIATSLLAVLMAAGLVVLVLWALSGST